MHICQFLIRKFGTTLNISSERFNMGLNYSDFGKQQKERGTIDIAQR